MAGRARAVRPDGFATLFFDTGGVLALARRERRAHAFLEQARRYRASLWMSSLTLAEPVPSRDQMAVEWTMSRLRRRGVTEADCVRAAKLAAAAGEGAGTVNVLIAAAVLRSPKPVVLLTGDPKSMRLLLAGRPGVAVVGV